MALIMDIKINRRPIYYVGVENTEGKNTGLIAYRVKLLNEHQDLLAEDLVAHTYEDGALALCKKAMDLINRSDKFKEYIK